MQSRRFRDDYREVAQRLNQRIDRLAEDLLPNGHREGRRWWRIGSLAGEPGQSLAVELQGHKRGRWRDYASGEGGDGLDLIAAVRFNGDKRQAFDWARQWLSLPETLQSAAHTRARARAPAAATGYAAAAKRIWLEARRLEPGDPVTRYLDERGIELARLGPPGQWPRALRYHPQLWNGPSRRYWPAMVAAVTAADGAMNAVHCTWLEIDPFGVTKAPIADRKGPRGGAKRTLGGYAGGCIRLWRGASGKRWPAMPAGEILMLGEGIEDTLSAVFNRSAWRAACAVALGSMLALELPPQVETIVILAQNDRRPEGYQGGQDADRLLRKVVRRWVGEGRVVRVARPPAFVKDWNDLALWGRKHATDIAWLDWGEDDRRDRDRDRAER